MKATVVCSTLFCSVVLIGSLAAAEQIPARSEVLAGLRPEHPRILATAADFANLEQQCRSNTELAAWFKQLRKDADQLLKALPVKYEIPDGKRLLAVSRKTKERVLLLGMVYRLTRERRYAERAWQELTTVTHFKDWNPSHFLDTAEMTFAVAVGYDWLFDVWTADQRMELREAIVRLGFGPGLTVYRKGQGWSKAIHNWNQVCNGGLGVGALAIGDVEPELAAEVLHSALRSIPRAMHEFGPDGGWGEGPGYWDYATEYNVYFLAALETACGTDFGLSGLPGFATTAEFPIQLTGPTGLTFNFADAHDSWHGAPQLFWFATRFQTPEYAEAQRQFATERPSPLDLLWGSAWSGVSRTGGGRPLPLARHFQGVSVVTARGAWGDPRAMFVAFKGGSNRVNHGHLDLGTLVLDAFGQRWAVDLGPDDYNLPGYFGGQRWSYLRNNTHGHNTLLLGNADQSPDGMAPIVRFVDSAKMKAGVIDLTSAWPSAKRVWRGVSLLDGRRVLVQDEVETATATSATWQLLTGAEIELQGSSAVLKQGNQRLLVRCLSPEGLRWNVERVEATPPQRPIRDIRRLFVSSPVATKLQLAVLISAVDDSAAPPPPVPLVDWQ